MEIALVILDELSEHLDTSRIETLAQLHTWAWILARLPGGNPEACNGH